ncbi:glycosyltransferase [Negadavirga shengliensis]|uniref:Glycosyltransferase n=1 Tax=Negadavirga shengliensis TaxID=1389218 RepID=A0ABV9SZ99_9BACT
MNSPRALRTTELAKEFARQGHQVTVLVPKVEEHFEFEKEYNLQIKDLGHVRWSGVTLKGKGIGLLTRRFIRRFSKLLFEFPDIQLFGLVTRALKKESEYDMLVSVAVPYPIHWGVAASRNKYHPIAKTWVADCGDPYMGHKNDTFRRPFYFKWVEKWFCRKADFISVPFPGAKEAYYPEFREKIRVIPQGFSFPEIVKNVDKKKSRECVAFAYSGNIGSYKHYAIPFLQELENVNAAFEFYIYTREFDFWQRHCSPKLQEKCIIRSYLERGKLLHVLSEMDFLLHFPYELDVQKSLKLIDYQYLNIPILSYRNTEADKIKLNEYLNWNFDRRGLREDISQYKIENVTKQFLNLTLH